MPAGVIRSDGVGVGIEGIRASEESGAFCLEQDFYDGYDGQDIVIPL